MDNCILTCAMIKDGRGYNDGEIVFLTQLVHLPPNLVQLYYSHSIKIINKIKELNLDNETTWRSLYDNHVKEIEVEIEINNNGDDHAVTVLREKMFYNKFVMN